MNQPIDRLILVDLQSILLGFETQLGIEVSADIHDAISHSLSYLENDWSIKLEGRSIYEVRADSAVAAEIIDPFIAQMTACLKDLAYLMQTNLFYEEHGMTLKQLHYLGFDPQKLAASLAYLSRNSLYNNKDEFFDSILIAASRTETSVIRRLICVMGVFERLGYAEGVAVITNYLYVGLKVK